MNIDLQSRSNSLAHTTMKMSQAPPQFEENVINQGDYNASFVTFNPIIETGAPQREVQDLKFDN